MPNLAMTPPYSPIEPVTEVMHGVTIMDPYRWLEDQDSPRTRDWLRVQQDYARAYLDSIPGRKRTRERIRELLDVETYDSVQKAGLRYFFRKRLPGQEQPCIYFRESAEGEDQILIDPAERGTGPYTAVKPLRVSPDGRLLLYEVKEGGERSGRFEFFDVEARTALPDALPRGYLRGFVFAPDSKRFFYVHERIPLPRESAPAAYCHILGNGFDDDERVFCVSDCKKYRLSIVPGRDRLGFLLHRLEEANFTEFFLWRMGSKLPPEAIIPKSKSRFGPLLLEDGRILALTDDDAANLRIVEVRPRSGRDPDLIDIVPESDSVIQNWIVAGEHLFVCYFRALQSEVEIFDLAGQRTGRLPAKSSDSVRLFGSGDASELLFEQEALTQPPRLFRYSIATKSVSILAERKVLFNAGDFAHTRVWFSSKDGTAVPMFLAGRRDTLGRGARPTIMTAYGGFRVPTVPQFSVLVTALLEQGCVFALPNIRGGSEFGAQWHNGAKGRKRQVAVDDFNCAAEWLIQSGHTEETRLAIFGGSNSGLLVMAALTQRPELYRAALCMVPLVDMLRYHKFHNAWAWKEEFGTAEDPEDFAALLAYSPYHNARDGTAYPATMIVSGDMDQKCDASHARKMTARLQAANTSGLPIFLDYSRSRGHSPVLPLTTRLESLTDRVAFLSDQLRLVW